MSVLERLFGSQSGGGQGSEHPCSNCPGDCPIAGDACGICRPYKEKLVDALYNVEHAEELRARYVVAPAGAPAGTVTCPFCGAPSADRATCEYCGMQIGEADGKIYVAGAAEIPNPILIARDIIYERYAALGSRYTGRSAYLSQIGIQKSGGILSGLLELLSGGNSEGLGTKMTEAEILEAARLYGVSAAQYLGGLDNGSYLPLSEKLKADRQQVNAAGAASVSDLGYAGRRPDPAPRMPRRPPHSPPPPRRPAGDERRFDAPGRGGAPKRPPADFPEPRRNERGGIRPAQPQPPARKADAGRSGGPVRRPEGPAMQQGGNRRSGGTRRLEPPKRPGSGDRGGRRR